MSGKMYHCNICDCEVSIKCKNKHLKTKKHNDNLNKNNEDDNDKKQCVRCFKKKNLDLFKDNNITCNYCLDVSSAYRKNNPEKTAEWKKARFEKTKDEVTYCPVCDYSVRKYKWKQHEQSVGHQYLLNMNEAGERVDKPDRTKLDREGRVFCGCDACGEILMKCMWGSHVASANHQECKNNSIKKGVSQSYVLFFSV